MGLVHYNTFGSDYDEWIPYGSRRIFPYPVSSAVTIRARFGPLCRCKVLRLSSCGSMMVRFEDSAFGDDEWVRYGCSRIGPDYSKSLPKGARASILSPQKVWRDCTVRLHDVDSRCFLVHYNGYDPVHDEWIGYGSDAISSDIEELPRVGTTIRVLSPYGTWQCCTIVRHDPGDSCLLIHYDGLSDRHDEWIEYGSKRLAPSLEDSCPIGSKLSVLSPSRRWRTCEVMGHDLARSCFRVQYDGFDSEHNEWIDYESERIQPRKLVFPGPPKSVCAVEANPITLYSDFAYRTCGHPFKSSE